MAKKKDDVVRREITQEEQDRAVDSLNAAQVPIYDPLFKRAVKQAAIRCVNGQTESEVAREIGLRYLASLSRTWKSILEMHAGRRE